VSYDRGARLITGELPRGGSTRPASERPARPDRGAEERTRASS